MLHKLFSKKSFLPELLFWTLIIASISPFFLPGTFLTLDGGPHCFNSIVFRELLKHNTWYSSIYEINSFPVPNYTGNIVLVILNLFLPIHIAEKIIFILYFTITPIIFRKIIWLYNPENKLSPIFIFPFLQCIFIYYGFYNFCIGLIFLFYGILYICKHQKFNTKSFIVLFFICAGLYFSHIFTFLVFLIFIIAQLVQEKIGGENIKDLLKKSLQLSLIALPFIILSALYFKLNPSTENDNKWDVAHVLRFIFTAEYTCFYYFRLDWFVYILGSAFCLLVLFLVIKKIVSLLQKKSALRHNLTFLFTGIILFILAFLFPDSNGNAAYIVYRFLYLFVLFMVLFIACQNHHIIIKFLFTIVCIAAFISQITKVFKSQQELKTEYDHIMAVESYITKPNATLAPLFFGSNGFTANFSSYLGLKGNIILLENYEATVNYFPVKWNPSANCVETVRQTIENKEETFGNCRPDYILINTGNIQSEEHQNLLENIKKRYVLVYEAEPIYLFEDNYIALRKH